MCVLRYGVYSPVSSSLIVARNGLDGEILGCVGIEMALVSHRHSDASHSLKGEVMVGILCEARQRQKVIGVNARLLHRCVVR